VPWWKSSADSVAIISEVTTSTPSTVTVTSAVPYSSHSTSLVTAGHSLNSECKITSECILCNQYVVLSKLYATTVEVRITEML